MRLRRTLLSGLLAAILVAVVGAPPAARAAHINLSSSAPGGSPWDPRPTPPCYPESSPACCEEPQCCGQEGPADESGASPTGSADSTAPGSNPVEAATGREIVTRTDLVVNGVYPIRLTRRYDSQSEYDSPLGYGWAWNFDLRLFEYPDGSVRVRTSCGYLIRFTDTGGALTPEIGRNEELTAHPDGSYTLRYPRGAEAQFDADGHVTALADRHGNRLEMTYDAAGKQPLVGVSPFGVDPTRPTTTALVPQLTKIREVLADGTVTGREVTFTYDATTGRLTSATSSDGRTVTYVHDVDAGSGLTKGNLVEVQGLEGIDETYAYDDPNDPHNLTSWQLGQGMAFRVNTYDAEDRVATQAWGDRLIELDYSQPLETTVTRTIADDQGVVTGTAVTTYEYDTEGYLTRKVDALGHEWRYLRDANHFLERVEAYRNEGGTLVLETATDYVYGLDNNLKERRTDVGSGEVVTERWTHDDHWVAAREVVSSAEPGKVFRTEHTFHLDAQGRPRNIASIRRLRSDGSYEITSLSYDANGQLETITPPAVTPSDGLQIVRSYQGPADPQPGLLAGIEFQLGGSPDGHLARSFTHDAEGNVQTVTDARGNVTTYAWDDRGRLTSVTNAKGETTHLRYRGPSAAVAFTAAPPGLYLSEVEIGATAGAGEGQLRRFRVDALGRLERFERKDDAGTWATFESYLYDSDANRLRTTDATGRTLDFAWDAKGQLTSVTDAASNTTTFAYDARGNRVQVVDAKSRVTDFAYDPLGRLTQVDQTAESLLTRFTYDAAGNVTEVVDPKSQTTTYAYDALSRLTAVSQPLGQTVAYAYDGRGRLASVTNARGHVLRYAYAPWGGLEAVEHFLDDQAATPDRTVSYTYDLAGNLRSASDTDLVTSAPAGSPAADEPAGRLYTYTYDPLDRVDVATAHYIPGGDRTLDAAYDRFGNREGLTFTDGADVLAHSWAFDDLDRLTQATLAGASPLQFQYRANDELQVLTHGNGVTTTLAYHPHGPIDTITVDDASSSLLHLLDYSVDPVLNVDDVTETRGAGSPELFDYAYDGVDRLIQAQLPTAYGLPAQEDFTYDDAGNREDPADPAAYAYDANNRIQAGPASTTWTFDADGNVATRTVSGVEERFTFDRTNRLRAWERGPVGSPTATASYRYDPFGRRLEKTVDGTTTWFLWDGDDLLAEFDASGARTRRYTYAGGFAPVEVADPTGPGTEAVYAVDTDHLDTPRLLTDATGAPAWRASTQAYGQAAVDPGSTVTFNMRFPGQYLDAKTGLHYNRWRYFESASGRYINADPIGQRGAVNLHVYADNRPVTIKDPLGLIPPNWYRENVLHQRVPPTDAERREALRIGSFLLKAAGIGLLVSGHPALRGLGFLSGLTGEIAGSGPGSQPDGDNDNDGIPDHEDKDDDNDLIPDSLDPSPLVPCWPQKGECYTPVPKLTPSAFIPFDPTGICSEKNG